LSLLSIWFELLASGWISLFSLEFSFSRFLFFDEIVDVYYFDELEMIYVYYFEVLHFLMLAFLIDFGGFSRSLDLTSCVAWFLGAFGTMISSLS